MSFVQLTMPNEMRENGHACKFLIVAISTADEFRWQWKRVVILQSSYLIGGAVIGSANYDRWGYWPRDRSHNVLSCWGPRVPDQSRSMISRFPPQWNCSFTAVPPAWSTRYRSITLSRTSIFLSHFAWELYW